MFDSAIIAISLVSLASKDCALPLLLLLLLLLLLRVLLPFPPLLFLLIPLAPPQNPAPTRCTDPPWPSLADILPANLNVLRAIRAIRVFRLFRRLDALKQILISLGYAVKPVASAALFVLIFSSLYAVIGVVFFSEPEELKVIFHSFIH